MLLFIFNPLNAELNPFCHLLALLGAHHIFHVSRIRVKQGVPFFNYVLTQDNSTSPPLSRTDATCCSYPWILAISCNYWIANIELLYRMFQRESAILQENFFMLNYINVTGNTYIGILSFTEILTLYQCGALAVISFPVSLIHHPYTGHVRPWVDTERHAEVRALCNCLGFF
jgi:hypothetical protein